MTRPHQPLACLLVSFLLVAPCAAREAKLGGKPCVDTDYGFTMQMVEDFEPIPAQPDEKYVVKKYTGPEYTDDYTRYKSTLEIVWIPKDELVSILSSVVDATVERARSDSASF